MPVQEIDGYAISGTDLARFEHDRHRAGKRFQP